MAKHFHFTVDHMLGRQEVELVVSYICTPFVAATYWQPAEGGECEIVSIKHNGKLITLADAEEDALLEMAIARSVEDWAEDYAAEQDWRYQDYRDRLLTEKWERGT